MNKSNQTLGEFIIENQKNFPYSSGESRIFNSIRLAAKIVGYNLNKVGLVKFIPMVLHQRAPFFRGSLTMVEKLEECKPLQNFLKRNNYSLFLIYINPLGVNS